MLPDAAGTPGPAPRRWRWKPVAVAFAVAVFLTPLGLLASGGVSAKTPASARIWHHPLLDGYGFANDANPTVGYVVSTLVGLAVITAAVSGATWIVARIRHRTVRA